MVLLPAARRQEASKFGQGLRRRGFDLGGEAGQNGEGGGGKRSNRDSGNSLDHDGPLPWAFCGPSFGWPD
jgi:hypothetical protein